MQKLANEHKQFIIDNVCNRTSEELTDLLNITFNTTFEKKTVINYKKRMKLKSGINTKFKSGQVPHNLKKVGYEFVNSDGYILIKTENNDWQLKHRYIYEQQKSKIPKGFSVIFADGNKNNFDIDNLMLISEKEKMIMKNKHLIFNDKDLTKTGIMISKLIIKNHDLKNKRRKQNENTISKT